MKAPTSTLLALLAVAAAAIAAEPPATTQGQILLGGPPTVAAARLPINLPTALQLAHARPLDIQIAEQRLEAARAQLDKANVLCLPNLVIGADYSRHDGQIQDIRGSILTTSRSSYLLGAGPVLAFNFSEALFAPLAARQVVQAQQSAVQAAANNVLLAVAESYFNVQQARGDLAAAQANLARAEELLRRVEQLAKGFIPALEINRAKAEVYRRRVEAERATERWQTASAELARLLRLEPNVLVEPQEPPQLRVDLFDAKRAVDELIPIALANRPELAERQALVQATLDRLKSEKLRPLVPSLLIRGNATNPAGNLAGGYFGGGINNDASNFGGRGSIDVQLVWEFQNLGFGNKAAVRERQAQNFQATLELFRTQDAIAADVVQAQAQAYRAAERIAAAAEEVRNAVETVDKSLEGMTQTRRQGELLVLLIRPQEVAAALNSLDTAYRDYYAAVADSNRAQFRLYRALGQPAQCVLTNQGVPKPGTTLP